jgi:hypothetical protein
MRVRKRPVCCDFCGSDTVNMNRICGRCLEGVEKHDEEPKPKPDDYHSCLGCGEQIPSCRCDDPRFWAERELKECLG